MQKSTKVIAIIIIAFSIFLNSCKKTDYLKTNSESKIESNSLIRIEIIAMMKTF